MLSDKSRGMKMRSMVRCALAVFVLVTSGCRDATQLRLELKTDLPCDRVHGVAITTGEHGRLEDRPPSLVVDDWNQTPTLDATACDPATGKLRATLLVPGGKKDAEIALKIVAAVNQPSVERCQPSASHAQDTGYEGCIVARRTLRYLKHEALTLPVGLNLDCRDKSCDGETTCYEGECLPARIPEDTLRRCLNDPARCGPDALFEPIKLGTKADMLITSPPASFSASRDAVCAVDVEQRLYCWGSSVNGLPSMAPITAPSALATELRWRMVSTGDRHTCGLRYAPNSPDDNTLWCWGDNADGQFGGPDLPSSLEPVRAGGDRTYSSVSVGLRHTCAIDKGVLFCWGSNAASAVGPACNGSASPCGPVRKPRRIEDAFPNLQIDDWKVVDTGVDFTCALRASGELYCWGDPADGRLGQDASLTPPGPSGSFGVGFDPYLSRVFGPDERLFRTVGCGAAHACAIDDLGRLSCWGRNDALQTGVDTGPLVPVPMLTEGGGFWKSVAVGVDHSCGLQQDNSLHCWGSNRSGQLGITPTEPEGEPLSVQGSVLPVLVGTRRDWKSAEASDGFTCARGDDDFLYCWGRNDAGQLGNGNLTPTSLPSPVPALQLGEEDPGEQGGSGQGGNGPGGCMREDGTPRCEGKSIYENCFCDEACVLRNDCCPNKPTMCTEGSGGAAGRAGMSGAAGSGGSAGAGGNAGSGAAGSGGDAGAGGSTGGPLVSQIATGAYHSCAIVENGEVRCWGDNGNGQLGDGTLESRSTPVPVLSQQGARLSGVQALALGYWHSCALLYNGEARCWGYNEFGQLGDGTIENRSTAVSVRATSGAGALTDVRELALGYGYAHSCALLNNGEVRCWGRNDFGQLGDGTTIPSPRPVPVLDSSVGLPLNGVKALALGELHSCALLTNGGARCWGNNDFGQLGDGTIEKRLFPVSVLGSGGLLTGVLELALGGKHSCALLTSGEAHCWGYNDSGQLGNGTTTMKPNPVPVLASPGGGAMKGVKALALGILHSCALLTSGEARCWGNNGDGRLGDGTLEARPTPVSVLQSPEGPPLIGVQALAPSWGHGCALLTSGEARCWGLNGDGQIGDGTTTRQPTPVPVQFPGGSFGPPSAAALTPGLPAASSAPTWSRPESISR
jgi:alpha-tubulin suppressor-like RCC1 family protein